MVAGLAQRDINLILITVKAPSDSLSEGERV